LIRDIEVTVLQCEHFMFARQSRDEMAADEAGRAGNDNFHRA
jgi:hypothetical protein